MLRASFVLLAVLLFGLFRLDQLNKTPIHPENFSTYNAVEIYALGVVMSALAYPVYPEIAREHMALYVKNKEDKHSCFFMQSAYVRQKVANYTKPTMRKNLFSRIKSGSKGGKPGQWSARKAQMLAKQYKAKGGGYK